MTLGTQLRGSCHNVGQTHLPCWSVEMTQCMEVTGDTKSPSWEAHTWLITGRVVGPPVRDEDQSWSIVDTNYTANKSIELTCYFL